MASDRARKLAREHATFHGNLLTGEEVYPCGLDPICSYHALVESAQAALDAEREEEREECAKVCDDLHEDQLPLMQRTLQPNGSYRFHTLEHAAAAIRARGGSRRG